MGRLNTYIFLIAVTVAGHVIARDTIFVADLYNSRIWAAPLDTLEFEALPLQNIVQPVAVDFDPVEHKVYWSDVGRRIISRAKLDGTEQQVVVGFLTVPDGLTIDVVNRHIYWTDTGTNTTGRANLDGSGQQIILQDGHDKPRAIVVDSAGGNRLFWTDWGTNPKIERSNLDGSERTIIVNTGLELPNGLALDLEGNRMYWCDAGVNTIETTDMDGGDRRKLFEFTPTSEIPDLHFFDSGLYDEYIYWSDWALIKIVRYNKYGGQQAIAVGSSVFERAGGLHVFTDTIDECVSNPCNNKGMCIDEIDYYQCNCTGTGYQGDICQIDVNECLQTPSVCDSAADCTNTFGSYMCQCRSGYQGDGITCTDVNECQQTPYVCNENADCTNRLGTYECKCKPGFDGDGISTCIDLDECSSFPCQNGGQCVDQVNAFICTCPNGYIGNICQFLSSGCKYPGDIQNGHVISAHGHTGDIYEPGEKVEFACANGYMLEGGVQQAFCQIDGTWSDENPVCKSEDGGVVSYTAAIGGGAGGGIVILILIIVLFVVCCKKSQPPASRGELPAIAVTCAANLTLPKEEGLYNAAFDQYAANHNVQWTRPGTAETISSRKPAPIPSQSRPHPGHLYDDLDNIQGAAGMQSPPSYIDVIGDQEKEADENGYISMKQTIRKASGNSYEQNNIY
ncbi:uncharacterized protein [Amphiura filiformis]|uniref:uncharacterized protein n=1 Tax=Amphiura filiformis TaxID=82378 RepID=UPI003B21E269